MRGSRTCIPRVLKAARRQAIALLATGKRRHKRVASLLATGKRQQKRSAGVFRSSKRHRDLLRISPTSATDSEGFHSCTGKTQEDACSIFGQAGVRSFAPNPLGGWVNYELKCNIGQWAACQEHVECQRTTEHPYGSCKAIAGAACRASGLQGACKLGGGLAFGQGEYLTCELELAISAGIHALERRSTAGTIALQDAAPAAATGVDMHEQGHTTQVLKSEPAEQDARTEQAATEFGAADSGGMNDDVATSAEPALKRYDGCWNVGTDIGSRDAACEGDLVCARAGYDSRSHGDCEGEHCCSLQASGERALLDADGFKDVTGLCCPLEMEVFFNRLLDALGYEVCSKPHVQGLMHWFSCVPDMDFQYVLDVIEDGNPCKFWTPKGMDCPVLSAQCAGEWCR